MTIYQRVMSVLPLLHQWKALRGSTKTKNSKQAERVEARKRVAAEAGESLRPNGCLWFGISLSNS